MSEQAYKPYLSVAEAAELLGVRPDVVYAWINGNAIPASNVAVTADGERPRWRISRVALQNFMFEREAGLRGFIKR